MTDLRTPLTNDDLKRLDDLLTYDVGPQGLSVDRVDGLLHALAIGPMTLDPSRWIHLIWGGVRGAPSRLPEDKLIEVTDLVFRRMNQVVGGFAGDHYHVVPIFKTQLSQGRSLTDPTGFAEGFMAGLDLTRGAWGECLDQPCLSVIRALGDKTEPLELDDLETLQQLSDASAQVVKSLIEIYEFWIVKRIAAKEVALAKVGRNDPCPCNSGKKYKQCCLT